MGADLHKPPAPDASPEAARDLEAPPVGGSWRRIYAVVLGTLVVLIGFLAWLAAVYR